jgi:ACS family hexuronate transporter-like MFS transporter
MQSQHPVDRPAVPVRAWVLLGLVAIAAVLFMMDRQVLSLLKTTLRDEMGLTDVQYGWLITGFMVPYTVMYLFTGGWIDRWGTRVMSLVFIGTMSAATLLNGLARNFEEMFLCRVLLGAAEAGIIPASILFVYTWFPDDRRATAAGIKSPIALLGTMSTPLLVAFLAENFGWRVAFVMPGVIGLFVAAGWWWLDKNPPHYGAPKKAAAPRVSAFGLLRQRRIWPLLAARILSDPFWFFLLYWHAPFLREKLGVSLGDLGRWVWILPLAGSLANLGAGIFSDRLIARGQPLFKARVLPLLLTAGIAPLAWLLPQTDSIRMAVLLLAGLYVMCYAWTLITNLFVADIVGRENVATGVAVISAMGGATSAAFNLIAGWLVTHAGYTPLFIAGSLLHPLAAIVLWRAYYQRPEPATA